MAARERRQNSDTRRTESKSNRLEVTSFSSSLSTETTMTEAWEYYGEPEPFELSAAATRFFPIAATAHERLGALRAYDTDIQLIPLDPVGGKRPAKGFLPDQQVVQKSREGLALTAA